jgi:hypothetical protein
MMQIAKCKLCAPASNDCCKAADLPTFTQQSTAAETHSSEAAPENVCCAVIVETAGLSIMVAFPSPLGPLSADNNIKNSLKTFQLSELHLDKQRYPQKSHR